MDSYVDYALQHGRVTHIHDISESELYPLPHAVKSVIVSSDNDARRIGLKKHASIDSSYRGKPIVVDGTHGVVTRVSVTNKVVHDNSLTTFFLISGSVLLFGAFTWLSQYINSPSLLFASFLLTIFTIAFNMMKAINILGSPGSLEVSYVEIWPGYKQDYDTVTKVSSSCFRNGKSIVEKFIESSIHAMINGDTNSLNIAYAIVVSSEKAWRKSQLHPEDA